MVITMCCCGGFHNNCRAGSEATNLTVWAFESQLAYILALVYISATLQECNNYITLQECNN